MGIPQDPTVISTQCILDQIHTIKQNIERDANSAWGEKMGKKLKAANCSFYYSGPYSGFGPGYDAGYKGDDWCSTYHQSTMKIKDVNGIGAFFCSDKANDKANDQYNQKCRDKIGKMKIPEVYSSQTNKKLDALTEFGKQFKEFKKNVAKLNSILE